MIDATVDGGGHARAILPRISPNGRLLGIDRDPEMYREAKKNLADFGDRVILARGNFADIAAIAEGAEVTQPSLILFDLGFSSYHLDSGRGFSFLKRDEPLDMRFGADEQLTAEALVNHAPYEELGRVFSEYGEMRNARHLARLIAEERKRREFKTVGDLLVLVEGISGGRGRINPATKIFQALRIAVNNELVHAATAVRAAFTILKPGGRLGVISFHSLEDRIIKTFFKEMKHEADVLTPKPVTPTWDEIRTNPRARSAKLRVIQKTTV